MSKKSRIFADCKLFMTTELLSRNNSQALRGVAAIGILVFHILLRYSISPVFNMWGGLFVAVFLILSGYGLEESFRQNGLDGFWMKRCQKVLLPFVFFVCTYNYLFPFLLPDGWFSSGDAMRKCLDELLYVRPAFWFIFFILKCYAVYWIGTRFLSGRLRLFFFVLCALFSLNTKAPCAHLEAEQSFSFLAGVLLSMHKDSLETLSGRGIRNWTLLLLLVGALFFGLKMIPPLHRLSGTIAYNYLLCPFRLSTGLAAIPLLTMLRVGSSSLLRTAGRYSLEIYVAHIPFIRMINDAPSTAVFLACSAIGLAIFVVYRRFVEGRLSIAETLFIIVNVLFVAKYSARISETAGLFATLAALVFYYVLLSLITHYYIYKGAELGAWSKRIGWGACLLAFTGMLAVQYAIDPYSIQVDRWSALHFPIQNLLDGIYPYSANTHLGGNASPFPVWQILHIPFYLMGNVGLSFFVAVALFIWSSWKVWGGNRALIVSLLLFSSVAVWYEVSVRSDFITNFLLLAAIINLVFPHMKQEWVERNGCWIAISVGLLTCTRILVLIPIAMLLLPYFVRMNWRRQVLVSLLTISVFALSFLPFALWDWQEFYHFQNNPWALQMRQGNPLDFIIFLPLAVCLAMTHGSNAFRYYRNSALMLAVFVSVTFIHNMYSGSNWDVFSSAYDITYFSSALPFCLLSITEINDVGQENVSIV